MTEHQRIVIAGGGFAGLALALALRTGLGTAFDVIVADPALGTRPSRDPRASAIIAAGRNLFEVLGIWNEVAPNAQPIVDMIVTSVAETRGPRVLENLRRIKQSVNTLKVDDPKLPLGD